MARGKYKQRKSNRDAGELQAEIFALTVQIAQARERLDAARRASAERADLEALLQQRLTDRDAAVAPEVEKLTADVEVLKEVLALSRSAQEQTQAGMDAYFDRYLKQHRNALEGIEDFIGGALQVVDGPGRRKLDRAANLKLDIAKGERRRDSAYARAAGRTALERAVWLAPPSVQMEWRAWLAACDESEVQLPAPAAVEEVLAQWRHATAATLTPSVAVAGHPHPNVDTRIDIDHPLVSVLGVDLTAADPSPRREPPSLDPLLSDRAFYALRDPWKMTDHLLPRWRIGREITSDPARIPTPLHHLPRHPSPADAVATVHWYSLAAAGAWARNAADPAAAAYGEVAVALATATTYWLPPGQVQGYLDSEPISTEDRANLRLGYPNVYLALGQPIVLPPLAGDHGAVDTEFLEGATHRLVGSRSGGSWPLSQLDRATVGSALDLIAAKGAQIEGVLLLGDDEGRPSGRVAWCLSVPGRSGVLGRWVLPAHRDRTAYAEQVDALLAVAAWADWHAPADPETPTSTHRSSAALQRAAARGRVHVLNAVRTTSAGHASRATGRTVSAHLRRGHWRRQPYGPGRLQTRMVRIAPAVVGAGTPPRRPVIYRLPDTSRSAADGAGCDPDQ